MTRPLFSNAVDGVIHDMTKSPFSQTIPLPSSVADSSVFIFNVLARLEAHALVPSEEKVRFFHKPFNEPLRV